MDKKSLMWLGLIVVVALVLGQLFPGANKDQSNTGPQVTESVKFSDLVQVLADNPKSVKKLTFVNGKNEVLVEQEGKKPYTVAVPEEGKQYLLTKASDAKVPVDAQTQELSGWVYFLFQFGPFLLLILFFFIMPMLAQRQQMQMRGMMGQAPGTKQNGVPEADKKTFADVAGCDEAKQEMLEVVEYLKNPGLLEHLGGRAPKGVLLVGPPGSGKTLMAKATAGEADVPFFSVSGSDFVEMFVGVGASRVRNLFDQARKSKPAVVFIDEIDAVGRQRGAGIGGGHDEREQTLNQLLVEIDGFIGSSGIVLIAATNRPDILDPALVRPGRFDRQVLVDLPDVNGRESIFKVHTRNKKLSPDINLRALAERTPGFSGAAIEGVCNEAAAVAARRIKALLAELRKSGNVNEQEIDKQVAHLITMADFDEGIDRVQMGPASTTRIKAMSPEDMKNIAIHEVGHAVLSELLAGGDPVSKITIIPRSRALGYTQALPKGDRYNYTREQLLSRIIMAMGGRAAQEVILNTVDTGAQNDFKQAQGIARRMVTEFGMSRLGPISVSDDDMGPFLGRTMAMASGVGPQLSNEIDREWRCITEGCLAKAKQLIGQHEAFVRAAADVLLKKETLLPPEWQALLAEHGITLHQIEANINCNEKPTTVAEPAAGAEEPNGCKCDQ